MTKLHKYPFLRLLLPLMGGIFLGDYLTFRGYALHLHVVFICLGIAGAGVLCTIFVRRYSLRWLFGAFFTTLCLLSGVVRMVLDMQETVMEFPEKEAIYRACIMENPKEKERSILCKVQLVKVDSFAPGNREELFSRGRSAVLLYLAKDSLSKLLGSGDELLVSSRISPPANNGNPDEFDYERYSLRKGVSGAGYVASGRWTKIAFHPPATFLSKALASREHLLNVYRSLGFEGETFAVLSALTVGYVDELDEELLESYSVSGASHILSLSGLHIGFLYALLFLLLRVIPGRGIPTRMTRSFVIILSLWAFAFFTGLSPSVVRSVCMFSLFALSYLFRRKSFTYNTLFATAFFMLLYSPAWLFDVGFQLSFCAVFAILWIQPVLYRSISVRTRAGRYVWGLMTVSIAAQVGTAPLVLLYFSRFSTHFLLTNLLVIPLASIILYASVVLLVCMPFPLVQSWVAIGLRVLVEVLNVSVRWVEQLPYSSIDRVWIYPVEVIGFYLVLVACMRFLQRPVARRAILALTSVLSLCICHTAMQIYDRPRKSIRFYHLKECPVVHCVAADGASWLVYADSMPDEARLRRVASRHWARQRLAEPQGVYGDYSQSVEVHNHIISYGGRRICILNDNHWRNKTTSHPLSIDYLYLCKGYTGRLEWIAGLFDVKRVIFDSSLPAYRLKALKEECRRKGIGFVSLSEQGSVRFML